MPRRRSANENQRPSDFLTVRQVAEALSCDRSTVYAMIERGELVAVKLFHENGNLRIPRSNYEAYRDRMVGLGQIEADRRRAPPATRPRRRARVAADTPEHRAAVEYLRAQGILR